MKHSLIHRKHSNSPFGKVLLVAVFFLFSFDVVLAQDSSATNQVFRADMRAASSAVLVSGAASVRLWGVEEILAASPAFKLRARTALANVISGDKVECEIKKRTSTGISAQCVNATNLDLGLYMIQQGYVSVDRGAVFGTVFEDAYVQAEMEAQERARGIWAKADEGSSGGSSDGSLLMTFAFILFLCIIVAFTGLAIVIMRGFKQVIEAQNSNMDMMAKERKLKNKERSIVATMLDSELKANKSKIEAYLVVYEEMLSELKNPEKPNKYQKAGDIVQLSPSLSRAIFDRNNDKLDIMGHDLSSELIHFYARIKTSPDYENLEPEMPLDDAIKVVEDAVGGARRMNNLADRLIEAFEGSGVLREMQRAGD